MNYFHCDATLSLHEHTDVTGATARHIRDSRRMKVGDEIIVQDTVPRRYRATIVQCDPRSITIEPIAEIVLPHEPIRHVTLLQALISEQNIDLVLQKTTELGVASIVLFDADHSPHTFKTDRTDHKIERWNNILLAACEQSGRVEPPHLSLTSSLDEALRAIDGACVLLDENGDRWETLCLATLGDTGSPTSIALIVGPEGGLSEAEKDKARAYGARLVKIGPYTLRAETAAVAGITLFV